MFYDLKIKNQKPWRKLGSANAVIIGDVTLEKNSSVWFNATLRVISKI